MLCEGAAKEDKFPLVKRQKERRGRRFFWQETQELVALHASIYADWRLFHS